MLFLIIKSYHQIAPLIHGYVVNINLAALVPLNIKFLIIIPKMQRYLIKVFINIRNRRVKSNQQYKILRLLLHRSSKNLIYIQSSSRAYWRHLYKFTNSIKEMGKNRKAQKIAKDQTRLRLQLFYLDELVQIASESLCRLEMPVELLMMQSANYMEQQDQGTKGARSNSPSPDSRTAKNGQVRKQQEKLTFSCLAATDFSEPSSNSHLYIKEDQWELSPFDFGRDPEILKQQRVFFRERLPSNNLTNGLGNARESLLAMRKKGSFLFREFKVPSQSEIEAAKRAAEQNMQQAEQSTSSHNTYSLALSASAPHNTLLPAILKLAPNDSLGGSYGARGAASLEKNLRGYSFLEKGSADNNSASAYQFQRRISYEQDHTKQGNQMKEHHRYEVSSAAEPIGNNEGADERLASEDGEQSIFSFAPKPARKSQRQHRGAATQNPIFSGSGTVSGARGKLNGAQSMNSLKSESGSSNLFDDEFCSDNDEERKSNQNSSIGSAAYMQQLNVKTLERVNIAEKKLLRGQGCSGYFSRKMSCQVEDDFFKKNSNYRLLKAQEISMQTSSFHKARTGSIVLNSAKTQKGEAINSLIRVNSTDVTKDYNELQGTQILAPMTQGSNNSDQSINNNSSGASPGCNRNLNQPSKFKEVQSIVCGLTNKKNQTKAANQIARGDSIVTNKRSGPQKYYGKSNGARKSQKSSSIVSCRDGPHLPIRLEEPIYDRRALKNQLMNPSWINKEDIEQEQRKNCLSYLRRISRVLRSSHQQAQGVITEQQPLPISQQPAQNQSEPQYGGASIVTDDDYSRCFSQQNFEFTSIQPQNFDAPQNSASFQRYQYPKSSINSAAAQLSINGFPNGMINQQVTQQQLGSMPQDTSQSLIKCRACSPIIEEEESAEEIKLPFRREKSRKQQVYKQSPSMDLASCMNQYAENKAPSFKNSGDYSRIPSSSSSSYNRQPSSQKKSLFEQRNSSPSHQNLSSSQIQDDSGDSNRVLISADKQEYRSSNSHAVASHYLMHSKKASRKSSSSNASIVKETSSKKNSNFKGLKHNLKDLDRSISGFGDDSFTNMTLEDLNNAEGATPENLHVEYKGQQYFDYSSGQRRASIQKRMVPAAAEQQIQSNYQSRDSYASKPSVENIDHDLDNFQVQMAKLFAKKSGLNNSLTQNDKKKSCNLPSDRPFESDKSPEQIFQKAAASFGRQQSCFIPQNKMKESAERRSSLLCSINSTTVQQQPGNEPPMKFYSSFYASSTSNRKSISPLKKGGSAEEVIFNHNSSRLNITNAPLKSSDFVKKD